MVYKIILFNCESVITSQTVDLPRFTYSLEVKSRIYYFYLSRVKIIINP